MSQRLTGIKLPGVFGSGVADYGKKSISEMVDFIRAYARNQKAVAEAILAAPDSAFLIETYTGVHVRKNVETLQEGVSALPSRCQEGV